MGLYCKDQDEGEEGRVLELKSDGDVRDMMRLEEERGWRDVLVVKFEVEDEKEGERFHWLGGRAKKEVGEVRFEFGD